MQFNGIYIRDLGSSPAAVSRRTGELYLSPFFFDLPQEYQIFILEHEWGHYRLNTKSELKADKNAFFNYAAAGLPLSKAVLALEEVLDMNNPAHAYRAEQVFNHALAFDYFINPSRQKLKTKESRMDAIQMAFEAKKKAMHVLLQAGDFDEAELIALELYNMMPEEAQAEFWEQMQSTFADYQIVLYHGADLEGYHGDDIENYGDEELEYEGEDIENYDDVCAGGDDEEDVEYLAGKGRAGAAKTAAADKKAQRGANKQTAIDNRQYKKTSATDRANERVAAKADKIRAIGDAKITKANAKLELAKQGISPTGEAFKALGGMVKDVTGVFKKGEEPSEDGMADPSAYVQQSSQEEQPPAEKEGMATWIWVLIVLAIVLAIGVGVFFYVKSRKKA